MHTDNTYCFLFPRLVRLNRVLLYIIYPQVISILIHNKDEWSLSTLKNNIFVTSLIHDVIQYTPLNWDTG